MIFKKEYKFIWGNTFLIELICQGFVIGNIDFLQIEQIEKIERAKIRSYCL